MATKVKILKMLQELRGLAQITERRPSPRLPGLFLLQMRSHLAQTTLARRKSTIPVTIQDRPDIQHTIKINHVAPGTVPATTIQVRRITLPQNTQHPLPSE
jgi:hypothetical protein